MPLAIRMGCKVIENKRRGRKRQCECQMKARPGINQRQNLSAWQAMDQWIKSRQTQQCAIVVQTGLCCLAVEF